MAAGPIFPHSAFPVTAGNVFPFIYVGGGANSKQDVGLGVAASIGADSTWRLRFKMPTGIPGGTFTFKAWALANATSGVAKYTVSWANVAAGSSPSGATLSGEAQQTLTWGAGDNDKYKESSFATSLVPAGNNEIVTDMVFNTSGWTLAQPSCWIVSVVWV